jgi:AcrR family transcriptional regulator
MTKSQATVPARSGSEDLDYSRPGPDSATTRERILEAALDHFIALGFDGTSLRQIAETVGLTKAALYYYFASKDDILTALHLRLHESGRIPLAFDGGGPITVGRWGALLEGMVDQMLAEPKLYLLHERNQAAIERLHREEAAAQHGDIHELFRSVLADERVTLEDRMRIAASFGVVLSGPVLALTPFSSIAASDLRNRLSTILWDVLQG